MDSFPKTFTASVETTEFTSFQYPWHLGTIERVARDCVENIFRSRVKAEVPVLTVALMYDQKIFDVWDGKEWINSALAKADAEMQMEWA
jgi:hypothetical protein